MPNEKDITYCELVDENGHVLSTAMLTNVSKQILKDFAKREVQQQL